MLVLRSGLQKQETHSDEAGGSISRAFVITMGIDIFIDGCLIGIGFRAGEKEGTLLTVALAVEMLSLGFATAVTLLPAIGKTSSVLLTSTLASLIMVGAVVGAAVLSKVPETAFEVILTFALAALLFLVTEELLVEAHEVPETRMTTGMFFAGFLLFLMLGMV
jgi:ZIP family zinc transporter